MIRPTIPEDTPALLALTEGTGLFLPLDIETLKEVLEEYHELFAEEGHVCVTAERDGKIIGFTYYAPAPMTDRTWYLWWIVVAKDTQARGIGGQLLKHAEQGAKKGDGRLMIVETSGLGTYELTRKFYVKHKYDVAGIIKDYYADGHDMYIFSKRL
jgi:ribosomal protein S18 acetylase RimI-like enzyme